MRRGFLLLAKLPDSGLGGRSQRDVHAEAAEGQVADGGERRQQWETKSLELLAAVAVTPGGGNPAAAAQLSIRYEYEALEVDYVEAGPFFTGDNFPIEIVDEPSDGTLDIFIYYLPDMNSDQSEGGTWSIATVHFITKQIR